MSNLHAPVILDLAGPALGADDRRRLRHPLVGGLILFSRNWQGRQRLAELCAEVKALRPELLIAVDHEGGRVAGAGRWTSPVPQAAACCSPATPPPPAATCSAPSCAPAAST